MLMMPRTVRIFVARQPADMRKAFDGLSAMVREVVRSDPMSGFLYCFFNKRRDRCKVIWWSGGGYYLLYTRLEKGTFSLAGLDQTDAASVEVTSSELAMILDGIDLSQARRRVRYDDQRNHAMAVMAH